MATFNKFNSFVEAIGQKKLNLNADSLKVVLTNTAPTAADDTLTDIIQIANGNGYTTGGTAAANNTYVQASGTAKLVVDDVVFTASGAMGPFRYAVLYDDTSTADDLIGFWDYGSSISLATGETFTVDFNQSTGVLTLA